MNSADSLPTVGLRFEVSSFDLCLYFVYRRTGSAAGAFATHIGDIPGCGEGNLLAKARGLGPRREAQEGSSVHVGMEVAQGKDFSATWTQADFAKNMNLFPTSPGLWAGRMAPLSMDYIKLRQRKLGDLCWVTAVSRPGICARLARIASRINAPRGSDLYRINELVRAAKDWQRAAVLKYASPSHPWKTLGSGGRFEGVLRKRGERVHGGSMTIVGGSGAAYGDQWAEGKCRAGYVIGLFSRRILQWASKFTREMKRSSLGGDFFSLGEMVDHAPSFGDLFRPFEGMSSGVV